MSPRSLLGCVVLTMAAALPAFAQPAPGGPGGPPFDPAQMRQRMMDALKDALAANDDEWKVIQPKVEKVQQLQRDAGGGGRGMFMLFGRGGPGGGPGGPPGGGGGFRPGGDPNQTPSAVQQKMEDLRNTLDNKDAKPDDIKAKLQALREARAQAKADLEKARGELRDLLTVRQESVLVMFGMLE